MKRCPQCGTELPDAARFCMTCGEAQKTNIAQNGDPRLPSQSERAIAAWGHGVAIAGSVQGSIILTGNHSVVELLNYTGSDPAKLRAKYLFELSREANRIPWTMLAEEYAHPERGESLGLAQVYTALDTTELEQVEQEEELRDFLAQVEQGKVRRIPAQEIANQEPRLVILGDPGSGKSTFINYISYTLSQAGLAKNPATWLERIAPWEHGVLLPVRISLRSLMPRLQGEQSGTAGLLLAHLREMLDLWQLEKFWPHLKEAIRGEKEQLLMLLDGLDEVPTAARKIIVRAVQDFVDRYRNHRYVVTCRPYAYIGQSCQLRNFRQVTLAPFNQDQVDHFISTWYQELVQRDRLSGQDAEARASQLQRAARRTDIWGLARRPLLLTVITLLHTFRGQLPEDRTEVYAEAVDLLLRRWESRIGVDEGILKQLNIPGLKMSDLEAGLYDVAFRAHGGTDEVERTADMDEADLRKWLAPYLGDDWNQAGAFVDYIRERAGLLVRHKTETYTFPHRTFQEFMAACHLVGRSDYPGEAARLTCEELSRWREVFILAGGHAARTHRLIQAISAANVLCPQDVRSVNQPGAVAYRRAQLAGDTLLEIGMVGVRREETGQAVLARVQDWLVSAMRADRVLKPKERAEAGNTLAGLGDPRFQEDAWYLPDEELLGFLKVPEGYFLMGTREDEISDLLDQSGIERQWFENEIPQQKLFLTEFYIARYPVTAAQFRAFNESRGYDLENVTNPPALDNHPVVRVNWHTAMEYCDWLTKTLRSWKGTPEPLATLLRKEAWQITLPSEAEWEKAARGIDGRIYPWGDHPDSSKANCSDTDIDATSPVGCFPRGRSPCGVEEMAGNIWEWTRSLYEDYPYHPQEDEEAIEVTDAPRVVRGGSFIYDESYIRCAFRNWATSSTSLDYGGFRIVLRPLSQELT